MADEMHQRLELILEESTNELQLQIATLVEWLRERYSDEQISQFLREGHVDFMSDDLRRVAEALAADVTAVYARAARETAKFISESMKTVIAFDSGDANVQTALRSFEMELVQDLVSEQNEVIRQAIVDGMLAGMNPLQTARRIRGSLGLTPYQAQVVQNFRRAIESGSRSVFDRALRDRRFDPTLARIVEGEYVDPARIDAMVERYQARMLAERAEVLALHQSQMAMHRGYEEMFRQMIDDGLLDKDRLTRSWHTAGDLKVRDSHAPMNGQTQPYDQPFVTAHGNRLWYPGDNRAPAKEIMRCRCVSTISGLQRGKLMM